MKKKLFFILIIIGFLLLFTIPCFAAGDVQLDKIDAGGNRILTIMRRIGYWIILIKAITDLIKAGIDGNKHKMGEIVFTYILIYGALFFIPWALRLVEGIF